MQSSPLKIYRFLRFFNLFFSAWFFNSLLIYFWRQFYIVVLGIVFDFSVHSFTFYNFYLDFYFPFLFGLLFLFSLFSMDFYFPFSLWTFISLFYLDVYFPFLFGHFLIFFFNSFQFYFNSFSILVQFSLFLFYSFFIQWRSHFGFLLIFFQLFMLTYIYCFINILLKCKFDGKVMLYQKLFQLILILHEKLC